MVKARSWEKSTTLIKGAWTPEEDQKLMAYIRRYGIWNWTEMPKYAGLLRCGKSCRLRWMNYLRPGVKRGNFTQDEDDTIIRLHDQLGNRWSIIASKLPGRTDNEVKNHWHSRLKKRSKNNPLLTQTAFVKANTNPPKAELSRSNSPKASNLGGCEETPISPQLSTDTLSSSSNSEPAEDEIYKNLTIEENNSSPGTYEEFQHFWELPCAMEGLYMMNDFGATNTDPGLMVSTSAPEALYLLPTPDSSKASNSDGCACEATQTSSQLSTENFSSSSSNSADEIHKNNSIEVNSSSEELQNFYEQPFTIEGLNTFADFGTTYTDPGSMVSTPLWGFQEDKFPSAFYYDAADDFWADI